MAENVLSILPSNFPEFKAQKTASLGPANRVEGFVGSQIAEDDKNASQASE